MFDFTEEEKSRLRFLIGESRTLLDPYIREDNLDMIKWLFDHCQNTPRHYCNPMVFAAQCGHLEIMKFLLSKGLFIDGHVFYSAVIADRVEAVEWLIQQDCEELTPRAMSFLTRTASPAMLALLEK